MCLFLCKHCSLQALCTGCSRFWSQCCREFCQNCNPCGVLFNLLLGFPGGLFVVLGGGLVPTVVHWLPGTFNSSVALWQHVCAVIEKGREVYSDDPNRRPRLCDCCTAAFAEIYCCLTPFFALLTLFMPFWMISVLFIQLVCDAFAGGCAGCVGTDVSKWWPSVSNVLLHLEADLAASAMRPEKAPVLKCCLGDVVPGRQRLPSTNGTNGGTVASAVPSATPTGYHQPAAATAPPPPPPPRNDPLDQMERAVGNAVREVATNLVFSGIRSVISGSNPPPQRGAQTSVPRATPVAAAVPVAAGRPIAAGRPGLL